MRTEVLAQAKDAKARGWTEQAAVLEDGILTDAEVDSMYSLYRECYAKTDAVLSPGHRSPIDGRTWFDWDLNQDDLTAADNRPMQDCQDRFDPALAISLRPKPMDAPLRRFVVACLGDADIEVSDADRDIQQIYRRVGEARVATLGDCISDGMQEEYPEIEGFSWGPPSVY